MSTTPPKQSWPSVATDLSWSARPAGDGTVLLEVRLRNDQTGEPFQVQFNLEGYQALDIASKLLTAASISWPVRPKETVS